jgi:hypothetical protein
MTEAVRASCRFRLERSRTEEMTPIINKRTLTVKMMLPFSRCETLFMKNLHSLSWIMPDDPHDD